MVEMKVMALAEADWRAVELTGDAETYLSAIAGLARFSRTPLPEASLRKIAARSGLSPERIPALLGGRIAPAGDRPPFPNLTKVSMRARLRLWPVPAD